MCTNMWPYTEEELEFINGKIERTTHAKSI